MHVNNNLLIKQNFSSENCEHYRTKKCRIALGESSTESKAPHNTKINGRGSANFFYLRERYNSTGYSKGTPASLVHKLH